MKEPANMIKLGLFKNLRSLLITTICPTIIFLITTQTIFKLKNIPFYMLVADPNEIGKLPPYAGMISLLGILFWCASATICIFIALAPGKNLSGQYKKLSKFLLFSGCLTLFILLDDLFQIHEYYFHPFMDVPTTAISRKTQNFFETFFFGVYGILISLYIYKFKSVFRRTNYYILLLSLLLFALSTLVDIATPENMFLHYTLEEGLKFIGIVTWFSYFLDCCYQHLQNLIVENEKYSVADLGPVQVYEGEGIEPNGTQKSFEC